MVRTTRVPSRAAFRLLTPWMRLYSKLGTSATRSSSPGGAHVDERFDLEPVPPQWAAVVLTRRGRVKAEDGQMPTPEHVVAVAKIRVPAPVAEVEERRQYLIPMGTETCDVSTPSAGQEAAPLGKIRAVRPGLPQTAVSQPGQRNHPHQP